MGKVKNCGKCAALCNAESTCMSYECSPTKKMCNLNTAPAPTKTKKYKDYFFCSKQQAPTTPPPTTRPTAAPTAAPTPPPTPASTASDTAACSLESQHQVQQWVPEEKMLRSEEEKGCCYISVQSECRDRNEQNRVLSKECE